MPWVQNAALVNRVVAIDAKSIGAVSSALTETYDAMRSPQPPAESVHESSSAANYGLNPSLVFDSDDDGEVIDILAEDPEPVAPAPADPPLLPLAAGGPLHRTDPSTESLSSGGPDDPEPPSPRDPMP